MVPVTNWKCVKILGAVIVTLMILHQQNFLLHDNVKIGKDVHPLSPNGSEANNTICEVGRVTKTDFVKFPVQIRISIKETNEWDKATLKTIWVFAELIYAFVAFVVISPLLICGSQMLLVFLAYRFYKFMENGKGGGRSGSHTQRKHVGKTVAPNRNRRRIRKNKLAAKTSPIALNNNRNRHGKLKPQPNRGKFCKILEAN